MSTAVVVALVVVGLGAWVVVPVVVAPRIGRRRGVAHPWVWGLFLGWIGVAIVARRLGREPTAAGFSGTILELRGVSVAFGGLKAVDSLDFHVGEREIVSLIGPNGAGKTTVLNLITGVTKPDSGDILLGGENLLSVERTWVRWLRRFSPRAVVAFIAAVRGVADRLLERRAGRWLRYVLKPLSWVLRLIARRLPSRHRALPPHKINQRGIARTFQSLRLFLNMTVKENVMAGQYGHTKATIVEQSLHLPRAHREEKQINQFAEEKLAFFGERLVGYRWNQPAYSLSYANRRRLEIARATATRPRLLLLDEPAAGMNPVETREMAQLIGKLRDEAGYAILLIEHDMHVVEAISDRVVALDHGVKIAEGTFGEVATDPRVVEAYLGTKAAATK